VTIERNLEMTMQHNLAVAMSHYEYLRDQLAAQFPDADEETLLDTLEGITDLHEAISTVMRARLNDLTLASALKSRISNMQERLSRIDTRAEALKAAIVTVMDRSGIKKITDPEFTMTLRPVTPGLELINEALIPEQFWAPQPPRLNRRDLLNTLKAGDAVSGAVLGNGGMTISVRTK
jgi:hypothetical protein